MGLDESWEETTAITFGMSSVSEKEGIFADCTSNSYWIDSLFWRATDLQTLSSIFITMCIQNYNFSATSKFIKEGFCCFFKRRPQATGLNVKFLRRSIGLPVSPSAVFGITFSTSSNTTHSSIFHKLYHKSEFILRSI
jgi:hypothetical protein